MSRETTVQYLNGGNIDGGIRFHSKDGRRRIAGYLREINHHANNEVTVVVRPLVPLEAESDSVIRLDKDHKVQTFDQFEFETMTLRQILDIPR